ncbi:NADH-quinone oxidoreductase subunit NuoK [Oscillatoria laete-virens NRMC-F 0139]|nr:NADH-quinone oxidoreductase subunit NuoK [Oscillatoria laete-virens]MDL5054722.1 NADH-quinone oxidoreductase subunit NuoK [Oscillatoria laete-virens NRMC-F 0139]
MTLQLLLAVAAVLFCAGLFGVLARRNVIVVLFSIELMFNAAHLNLIAFWRFGENPQAISGLVFLLLSLAVSGAEAAIGLALALRIYRHYKSVETSELKELKG